MLIDDHSSVRLRGVSGGVDHGYVLDHQRLGRGMTAGEGEERDHRQPDAQRTLRRGA